MTIPYLGAEQIRAALSPQQAVDAIAAALTGGFDPAADLPRNSLPTAHGEFLLMPSSTKTATGIKVLTVAYDNAARGLPVIQGIYVLVDHVTLTPVALLDGAALTGLRTPAVTMAACRELLKRDSGPLDVVVFGAGVQGRGHGETLQAALAGVRPIASLRYIVRHPELASSSLPWGVLAAGSAAAAEALSQANFVICATPATTPLFDSALLSDDVVVAAVGSHHPDRRELDSALLGRSQVFVEDVATALREPGDIVIPVAEGVIDPARLGSLAALIRGEATVAAHGPVVFKSAGMSWEDLTIAQAVVANAG